MIEQLEKQSKWYQDSILFKLGIIAILIMALIIPSAWIQDLVTEREGYQQKMVTEVNDGWSGPQLVQGPVLIVPYKKTYTETGADKKTVTTIVTENLYVLPESLNIKAAVHTEPFKRGIYNTTGFTAKMMLQGSFGKPDLGALGIGPTAVMYDKAKLVFGISDMNGLKNNPPVTIAGKTYTPEPAEAAANPLPGSLQVRFTSDSEGFAFSYPMEVKGSSELNFQHMAKTTDIEMSSDWNRPTFNGRFLPDDKRFTEKGFNAKWHMIYYKRPYPQQWVNQDSVLTSVNAKANAVFGVGLQPPIDQYRKVLRTTKYSTLIILLTFVSLLLTELIKKERIHLFNYTLIGAAMIVYYTLLLSMSEQIGFNYAYIISSVATIGLIAWFTASLFKNVMAAITFSGILSLFYGFVYVIIQLEELSLLVGSIALFIVVAALMYFSRRINWEQH